MSALEETIDKVLTYLSLSLPESHKTVKGDRWKWNVPLTYFSGAEPSHPDIWQTFAEAGPRSHEFLMFLPELVDYRTVHPCDVRFMGRLEGAAFDETFLLHRLRTLSVADLRGQKLYGTEHVEMATAQVKTDGSYLAFRHRHVHRGGGKWWDLYAPDALSQIEQDPHYEPLLTLTDTRPFRTPEEDLAQETDTLIQLGLSFALSFFYEWRVELGYENSPTLAFVTDPTGAREVFRLRDLPNGKSRREALRNWVIQHWRRRRDEDGYTKVRQHLRGTERFTWNGLHCTVHVSAYDTRKNEALRRARAQERRKGRGTLPSV